jgi:iron complex outermembrane receptor protein
MSDMTRRFSLLLIGGSILATSWSAAAAAQAEAPAVPAERAATRTSSLEDIIVTARRRDESLLDVPVAVTGVTAETLQRYNLDSLAKIGDQVPQVKLIQAASGSGAIFSIRGIGSSPLDSGVAQSVSVQIDGTQLSQGNLINLGQFDMQQVQVLKGPQALFFGKNSPAGVIVFTSRGPTKDLQVNGRAAYEFNADEKVFELGVSGPLTSNLGFRVAGRYRHMVGFTTNNIPAGQIDPILGLPIPEPRYRRDPRQRELSGRLTLQWEPLTDFTATLKVLGQRYRDNGAASVITQLACAPGQTVPTSFGVPDPNASCRFGKTHANGPFPDATIRDMPVDNGQSFSRQNSLIASLTLDYSGPTIGVTSVTSYSKYKLDQLGNFGGSTYAYAGGVNNEYFEGYSQELRFASDLDGPFNFLIGTYLEHSSVETVGYRFVGPLGPDPVTGRYYSFDSNPEIAADSVSAFLQARYNLLDNLELAGGARYTADNKKLKRFGNGYVHTFAAPILSPAGVLQTAKFSDDNISPEATLTYKPRPGMMIYAAYKTGYKSGGFGLPTVIGRGQLARSVELKSETSEGYEVGAKMELLDRRLRLQATAYDYKFDNLQTVAFNGALVQFVFGNAASSSTKGVELQVDWQATPELTFNAAGGYNKARYNGYDALCYAGQTVAQGCVNGVQSLSDVRLPHASDWSGNAGFNYDQPIGDFSLILYGQATYQSTFNASENNIPGAQAKGYATFNAGVRVGPSDQSWQLSVFAVNLTDKFIYTAANDKAGGRPGEINTTGVTRPRQIWVEGRFNF